MNGPDDRTARRRTLALWAVLLLLAVLQLLRTPFQADLSAFLPASPDARQRLLIEQIHSGLPSRTLLMAIDGGDAAARADASRRLAQALRADPQFDQVHNGAQDTVAGIGSWLFDHRYQLSPAIDGQRFSADGLREAITETLSLLGTPAGNAIKPLLPRDPSGETLRIAETLIPARAPRSEHGVWVARDAPRALLMATLQPTGGDIDRQAAAVDAARRAFEAQAAQGLQLTLSGAPVFAVDSRARMERDIHGLAAAGAVVVALLLWLAFGQLAALGVAWLPVALGIVAGIVAVGLVFGHVHGMTLGFGIALIGEAVDYAIYYLVQARQGGWWHWVRCSWPTVRLGLLTSVCGFAALMFSGFPGLAQLGVFAVAGLTMAALATRHLLPALMPDGARGSGLRGPLGRATRALLARMPPLRGPLLLLGVAAAVLLWQRGDLWRADLASLSPVPRAAIELDERLRADLGAGDGGTLVVVQGPDLQTTLQRAEAAGQRLEALIDQGVIAGFDSAARFLPSLATQQQRQAALPDSNTLQAALAEATAGGPLPADRLQPFVQDLAAARGAAPLTAEGLRGSPVAPLVDALLLQRADGSAAALMPLQPPPAPSSSTSPSSTAATPTLDESRVREALAGLPDAQVLDVGAELGSLYGRYLGEARTQALLGAGAVLLLMALWLRSPRRLWAVCQPLLLAPLLTLGGLAALGTPLGILHLVGLLLVVAVGSNYALFFDMLREDGSADDDTLASLLLANLTTVATFGILSLSSIPVLAAIGHVVAPGALLALVLAAAFAPRPRGGAAPASPSPP